MPVVAPLQLPAAPDALAPRAAFLLYRCDGRLIATVHPLKATRAGQAAIGAGRPLTHRELHGWLAALAGQARRTGAEWLPVEVLACGEDYSVWWRPARVAPLWFLSQGRRYGFRVPWPPLAFAARGRDLWCAALPKNARPRPETPLCHAPLMNVDAGGAVCLGTAEPPPDCDPARRRAWEATVCDTHFTHVNHDRTLRLDGGARASTEAHFAFWQGLHDTRRFPMTALEPMNLTVRGWLERIVR